MRCQRDGKSLVNTFPFNQDHEHGHHHGDHQVASSESLEGRDSKQGYGGDDEVSIAVSFSDISTAETGPDGQGGSGCSNMP